MSTPAEDLAALRKWLGRQDRELGEHRVAIEALQQGQARMDAALTDLQNEVRSANADTRADMRDGFARVQKTVTEANERALHSLTEEQAGRLADSARLEERSRNWAMTLLVAIVTLLAVTAVV